MRMKWLMGIQYSRLYSGTGMVLSEASQQQPAPYCQMSNQHLPAFYPAICCKSLKNKQHHKPKSCQNQFSKYSNIAYSCYVADSINIYLAHTLMCHIYSLAVILFIVFYTIKKNPIKYITVGVFCSCRLQPATKGETQSAPR